jgi:hypothetical protein
MKKLVILLLAIFFALGIQAQSRVGRFEYNQKVRSQLFKATTGSDTVGIPVRMSRINYKQRTRSQIIRMSETADSVKMFTGMLINNKIGLGEKVTFVISSTLVKDVPYCFTLEPQTKVPVSLPAGEYVVKTYCGNYYHENVFHVDPRRKHYFSGDWVYFGIEKNLSDI